MRSLLGSIFLCFGTLSLWAQYDPPASGKWSSKSPDGVYQASTRIVPGARADEDTAQLLVAMHNGAGEKGTYVRYDIPRLIAHIEWSPDSKFLVMTTVSAGGHSPWHFKSYVYSVGDKTLRYMDEVTGSVVAADFAFVGPHTVEMKVPSPSNEEVDFEHPQLKKVDLLEQTPQMQKLSGEIEGTIGK